MKTAYTLACESLPLHSSKFSRKDYTLPQLFACLVVKDLLKRSYRGAEALLQDSPDWLSDIGLSKAPDHNTRCRENKALLSECRVDKVLDTMAQWATQAKMLKLSTPPLAMDSTTSRRIGLLGSVIYLYLLARKYRLSFHVAIKKSLPKTWNRP